MYLTTTKSKDAEKYIYTETNVRTLKSFVPFQVELQDEDIMLTYDTSYERTVSWLKNSIA